MPRRKKQAKNRNYIADFMDYESKGITPSRFGDTTPQFSDIDDKNYDLLDNWYHKNGVANQIVSKPAQDATRNGWRLVIPDDPTMQATYQQALDDLNLKQVLTKELIYQRLHGDGFINFGIAEQGNGDLSNPIDPQNVQSVKFVHAFGDKYVRKVVANDDPTDDNFGKEQTLVMEPVSRGEQISKQGIELPNQVKADPTLIDASRYCHTSLDKLEDDKTGNSVLTLNADPVKVLDTALYSAGKILYGYSQLILKSDHLAREDPAKYREQMHVLSQGFSTESLVTMGADESLEKITTSVSGLDNLFTFAWQILNTGTGIPKSVLLGEQSGTLAGASQDVQNYYDMVKSIQEDVLKPQIKKLVRLLMWSQDIDGGYEDPDSFDWDIDFNPLWTPDDKTQSETMVNYANALSSAITAGIIDPDQAQKMFQGQNNNQISQMQTAETETDSADDMISKDQIEQYKKELKAINHGRKT